MKKKEVENIIKDVKTYYEAFDGTVFNQEEECAIYEDSAAGVLLNKLHNRALKTDVLESVFGDEPDEQLTHMCVLVTSEVLDLINQLRVMFNHKTLVGEDSIGDVFIIGYRKEAPHSIEWFGSTNLSKYIQDTTNNKYRITEAIDLSIYDRVQKVKFYERAQLVKALQKHGSMYDEGKIAIKFAEDTAPYVATYIGDQPGDAKVLEVSLNNGNNGTLEIKAYDEQAGQEFILDLDNIFAGQLDNIISAINN